MISKLGVYWSVMHRRPQDYEFFRQLQPSVLKIMDGGPNDYAWARQNLPHSLIIARDWALSEQHADMLRDPAGTGKRHAQEWHGHADRLGFDRANTLVLGINEPHVWEPGVPEALTAYTVAFCDECARLGLRAGAMQLGVGWPANTGPDTPPDWTPYASVEAAINRGNHVLICHEYWADQGPGELWGWWAGRALRCPWRVPIVIGECGVDMYVKDPGVSHHTRGWRGRVSPGRYAQELAEYVSRMSADSRFLGCCVFAADFANNEWQSFDIEPAYGAILATPIPVQPADKDHSVHVPIVGGPQPPHVEPKPKSEQSMSAINPLALEAIIAVESGHRAFGEDGRLLIRFEAHIFKTHLGNDTLFNRHFRHGSPPWTGQQFNPDGQGPWFEIHTGSQQAEYNAFELAKRLNSRAAHMAISMGAPQIMGFNHARIGFDSAQAMYARFSQSWYAQVIALINFCLGDPALVTALNNLDWRSVARIYNGPGNVDYAAPRYEQAYRKLAGV